MRCYLFFFTVLFRFLLSDVFVAIVIC
jgi:hypothetical protein